MFIDPWLPIGFHLPNGGLAKRAISEGQGWQIFEMSDGGRVLLAKERLAKRWIAFGLLDKDILHEINVSGENFYGLLSSGMHVLECISQSVAPRSKSEASAFVEALKLSRSINSENSFQNAIYTEKYSKLLPTHEIAAKVDDDVVLGTYLTGGVPVSVQSLRRILSLNAWLNQDDIEELSQSANLSFADVDSTSDVVAHGNQTFSLAGRKYLEDFFNEHIIDIVENKERYKALGISFPSACILYGPPGCGKTFAVEKLIDYLGWPSFKIEASTVASPYIHDTSKKIAAVFDNAMQNSPSIIVIDEMDAFLSERQGAHQHSVEEISEFLRRIPEAIKSDVLVIGMTNRIDAIDPAVLRRGRFDHLVKVEMATEEEILALLTKLVSELPTEEQIYLDKIASQLSGRPLSDVAFVVREGARLAARNGKSKLDQASLDAALSNVPAREDDDSSPSIGFKV